MTAIGLSDNPVHFDNDGTGDEVLSPEVDTCTMPGPTTGNEPPERQCATHRRQNEASVITGDLEAKDVHGMFLRVGS
jgi:hypothetical protein